MRPISDAMRKKLKGDSELQLSHKLLLYRNKWNGSAYVLETNPIDISDALEFKGTNIVINQQLDTQEANSWKVGTLSLTLYNESNRFWEGKDDGLFPSPFLLYGSKIEYYCGDPTINDYIKCFTGYMTSMPNFRQDDALITIQVLNRLDYLKTINAEVVSTTRTNQLLTTINNNEVRIPDPATGRILRVVQGTSVASGRVLIEKTDYSIENLNNYSVGASLNLTSSLLPGESVWATYIFWRRGITIDSLVNQLLDAAGITNRQVDPVRFSNAIRVANNSLLNNSWAWLVRVTANSFAPWWSGRLYSNDYFFYNAHNSGNSHGSWGCNISNGSVRCRVKRLSHVNASIQTGYVVLARDGVDSLRCQIGGAGANNRTLQISFPGQANYTTYGKLNDGDVFYFSISPTQIIVYVNNSVRASYSISNWKADTFRCSVGTGNTIFECDSIAAKTSSNPFNSENWYNYQAVIAQYQTPDSSFQGFDRMTGTLTVTAGNPNPQIRVAYGNGGTVGAEETYNLSVRLRQGFNTVRFRFLNNAAFGNNYTISALTLWSFQTSNILLGVCNLTNMNVLKAIQELAAMAMYEIGFDADDKFFFRRRGQSAALKELTDSEIKAMTQIQYDLERLATRVVIGYGNYNTVIESTEAHPNNMDKYGLRIYEMQGGQLLPADNIDLTFAVAPTIYSELSQLRLKVEVEMKLDFELELGDFVRIIHNNNLFSRPEFTDYTKWKELGTFFMRCRIEGIKSDFKKKTTILTLVDYTTAEELPLEEFESFMYQIQSSFGASKL